MRARRSRGGSGAPGGGAVPNPKVPPIMGAVAARVGLPGGPLRLGDVMGLGGRAIMVGKGQDPRDQVDWGLPGSVGSVGARLHATLLAW